MLTLTLFTAGCTNPEQDDQIRAFWHQQLAQVLGVTPPPVMPIETAPAEEIPPSTQQPPAEELLPPLEIETPAVVEPKTPSAKPAKPIGRPLRVFLFTHTNSPLCQQLKADHWDTDFQQQYQGQIILVEYDMINPSSRTPLRNLMRKHKMPSLTVPILFVGNTVLPGYPFTGVDQAVKQALADQARAARAKKIKTKTTQARLQNPTQFMEIIMEDEHPVKNKLASARDLRAMQLALATVERANQQTVTDIGSMFGSDTQAAAFAITSRTERLLRYQTSSSASYKSYLATQQKLLALQEKNLNDLMRQNAKNIRSIRG